MSLSNAKITLQATLFSIFEERKLEGEDNAKMALDMANAIHDYITSADVDITLVSSVTPPGTTLSTVVVTPTGPGTGTGATVAPTSPALHTGFGKLL